jgi:hypothetical protein
LEQRATSLPALFVRAGFEEGARAMPAARVAELARGLATLPDAFVIRTLGWHEPMNRARSKPRRMA